MHKLIYGLPTRLYEFVDERAVVDKFEASVVRRLQTELDQRALASYAAFGRALRECRDSQAANSSIASLEKCQTEFPTDFAGRPIVEAFLQAGGVHNSYSL